MLGALLFNVYFISVSLRFSINENIKHESIFLLIFYIYILN